MNNQFSQNTNMELWMKRSKVHPSWSIAITLKREARASKLRKKKPWEAAYPWTITSVGESSLLWNVTVLINRGSLLDERNHLTLESGGPEPILTCSWTYGVLPKKEKENIRVTDIGRFKTAETSESYIYPWSEEKNGVSSSIRKNRVSELRTWQEKEGVFQHWWCDRRKWGSNVRRKARNLGRLLKQQQRIRGCFCRCLLPFLFGYYESRTMMWNGGGKKLQKDTRNRLRIHIYEIMISHVA